MVALSPASLPLGGDGGGPSFMFFLVRRGREEQQKSNSGPPHACKDRHFHANRQIFCAILTRFNTKMTK